MSAPEIYHPSLNATFKGIERNDEGLPVHQFLGIKYASVPARFERAEPVENFAGATIDATKYGYVILVNPTLLSILTIQTVPVVPRLMWIFAIFFGFPRTFQLPRRQKMNLNV
jgi:hypothetical protein